MLRHRPLQLLTAIMMVLAASAIAVTSAAGLALVEPHDRAYPVSLLSVLEANYARWPDSGLQRRRLDAAVIAEAARDEIARNAAPAPGKITLVPLDLPPLPQAIAPDGSQLPPTPSSADQPTGIAAASATPMLQSPAPATGAPTSVPATGAPATPAPPIAQTPPVQPTAPRLPANTTARPTNAPTRLPEPPSATPSAPPALPSPAPSQTPTQTPVPTLVPPSPVPTLEPPPTPSNTPRPRPPTPTPVPPTATTTPTPVPPTPVPTPTPTPVPPTPVPTPTSTPVPPTATTTSTPVPTALPSNTPLPVPTDTSVPTNTPVPTDTPVPPTNTPIPPTQTPIPPALVVQIIVPSDGATISNASQTNFQAIAYDPAVGTADGDGISRVNFSITQLSGGSYTYTRLDSQSAYCVYGGNGPCATSPDWGSMTPGTYQLTATVSAPGKPNVSVSVTFTIP